MLTTGLIIATFTLGPVYVFLQDIKYRDLPDNALAHVCAWLVLALTCAMWPLAIEISTSVAEPYIGATAVQVLAGIAVWTLSQAFYVFTYLAVGANMFTAKPPLHFT